MVLNHVVQWVYRISFGFVNAFLLDQDGLTLIDTGLPGGEKRIFHALAELGRSPADIKQILITHLHRDHTGSLTAIKKRTGAPAFAHSADADLMRQGIFGRETLPAPGLLGIIFSKAMKSRKPPMGDIIEIEHDLLDGQVLSGTGGLQVVFTPGHTAGHTVFFWPQQGGVLFAGDALSRMFFEVGHAPIYENYQQARNSLKILSGLTYDTLCFSHGSPIIGRASRKLQPKLQKWMDDLN
jgi:glyoxylase-like metal-dependent hydrolase (beta-lactamase superfamily II)